MSTTQENLMAAFAGESQANRKYLAFAAQAEKEGHIGVAKLFKAAAAAETVHAHTHLRNMKGIGSTAENLKAAIRFSCVVLIGILLDEVIVFIRNNS